MEGPWESRQVSTMARRLAMVRLCSWHSNTSRGWSGQDVISFFRSRLPPRKFDGISDTYPPLPGVGALCLRLRLSCGSSDSLPLEPFLAVAFEDVPVAPCLQDRAEWAEYGCTSAADAGDLASSLALTKVRSAFPASGEGGRTTGLDRTWTRRVTGQVNPRDIEVPAC